LYISLVIGKIPLLKNSQEIEVEMKPVIKSQYHAALAMLRQAVEGCPPELWQRTKDQNQFWRLAYHGLFYTHLYLNVKEDDFAPWPLHQEKLVRLANDDQGVDEIPAYTQAEILDYIEYLGARIDEMVDALDFEGPSGFYWLPFNKLELQFYNIRHLMLHTGELAERLWQEAGVEVGWVGMHKE